MEADKVLSELGVGLSIILRYSYGGFLLIVLSSIVNPVGTAEILNAMPWQLAAFSALAIGAAIYAIHRSVVIPLHHIGLCVILWVKDLLTEVEPADSLSPTRWLGSIKVPWGDRILAYTALRRSNFFEHGKKAIDLAHAESGLVVMTFEGCVLAALFAKSHPTTSRVSFLSLAVLSAVLLVSSYPSGYVQHQRECRQMKLRRPEVEAVLRREGFL